MENGIDLQGDYVEEYTLLYYFMFLCFRNITNI